MIPVNKNTKEVLKNYNNGNCGLWFNKFIEIDDKEFKPIKNYVDKYKETYHKNKNAADKLLEMKHLHQYWFCKTFEKKYDILTIQTQLSSRMITGIGQTHPSEVGMTFDHTIGVPYIPASTVKGIIRFAHLLNIIEEPKNEDKILDKDEIDEEEDWTFIKHLFGIGGDKGNVGNVIFLDVYPAKSPDLAIDIINPHYQEYYSDESGKTSPGDYLDPVPIKFFTIAPGNKFIFRILIKKDIILDNDNTLFNLVKTAIGRVLTVEGIGAKTAVGYGRFNVIDYKELSHIVSKYEESCITKEEKLLIFKNEFIDRIKNIPKESNDINSLFDAWQNDDRIKDDKDIASYFKDKVKKKKANKEYTHQYQVIAVILDLELGNDVTKEEKYNSSDTQLEDEYEKAKKQIEKANGDNKKINKILKKQSKKVREKLKEELKLK
jgi:CRISPR-associated protein Cmr6